MSKAIFEVANLNLGYGNNSPLVALDKLTLKAGQITFITGPSGSGKSTLLEALGLMKNTLLPSEKTRLDLLSSEHEVHSLLNLWEMDGKALAMIRRRYYSFIFQRTNLMPNFSLGENMCLPGMLDGRSLSEIKPMALEHMATLNLEADLFDRPATIASGGQRQRASFVRALCKPFQVVFCDEPTGNLDKENAVALFSMLREKVKAENKSAIVVSHDHELSNQFSDEVLKLEYDANRMLYQIEGR